jgi:GTPase Era involved in 16S rRNA processing
MEDKRKALKRVSKNEIFIISAVTGSNVQKLMRRLHRQITALSDEEAHEEKDAIGDESTVRSWQP